MQNIHIWDLYRIEHRQIKDKLKGEFKKICQIVSKPELNARNKSKAYNELAVAKIINSFGVIKWTRQELEELDTTGIKENNAYGAVPPSTSCY